MSEILGSIAALATLPGFVLYLANVFKGRTKPHAFSWLVWSALNAIAFTAQVTEGGGPGSYVSAVVCAGTFTVFVAALFRGETRIVRADWICLAGAAAAGLAWLVTDDPLLSVILITVVDAFGSIPTFRKSFERPHEESTLLYALDAAAFIVAIAALETKSVETVLFAAFVAIADTALVVMILLRRKFLKT